MTVQWTMTSKNAIDKNEKSKKMHSYVKSWYMREDKKIIVRKQSKFAIMKSCLNPKF